MKIFGVIREIGSLVFRLTASGKTVTVVPAAQSATSNATVNVPDLGAGTPSRDMVLADLSQALTSKTIDAALNTISNISDTNVSATAAIARSKVATGSANHVVINSGTGALSSEAQLAATRGGTGVNSSATFPASGTITTDTGATTLQNKTIDSTNTISVKDTLFTVVDDGDVSKQIRFQASGITTGNVRTATMPDTDITLVGTAAAQVITAKDIDGGTASNTSRLTLPKAAKATLDALTRKQGTLVYASDTNKVYSDDGSLLNELGAGGISTTITQAAHGFTASDLGAVLYLSGSTYTKARSDAANTAEAVGMIGAILNVNQFTLTAAGAVTIATAVSGGAALVAGTVYFLSNASAGQITATEPSVVGQVSMPLGVAKDTTTLYLNIMRGSVIGGANLRTSLSLANNATSSVQSVAAYDAGELTGWVSITATSSLRFYVAAQFSKNGAASDWNIAYQTAGDTPPAGFSLAITSAGLIQAVMPSVAGYTAATINYALNAAAVGTSFPLSVQASAVLGATNGSAVAAGYIGETISQTRLRSSALALTSTTPVNLTATPLTLTPGVWRIVLFGAISPAFTTTFTTVKFAISKTSATLPAADTFGVPTSGEATSDWERSSGEQFGNDRTYSVEVPSYSVSSNTTIYLVVRADFATSTTSACGSIFATRIA